MWHEHFSVKFYTFAIIAGILAMLALVCILWAKPEHLVVVDMSRVIQAPSMMLARSKLSEASQLEIMEKISKVLPKVIAEYGKSHGVTVIGATVLASQSEVDVTQEIIALTIARVKHET
ncbi:MAG: TrbI F-type domain-containing protein [Legionella sp.]|nr:TrbI F-type domain-containing protein [Legionella sp.]